MMFDFVEYLNDFRIGAVMEIQLSKYQQKIFEHIKKYGINNIIWGGRLSGRTTILKVLKECGYIEK